MDKRLMKRHKRQVSREKARVVVSVPDVRTPEQIKAAREASSPDASRGNQPHAISSMRSRNRGRVAAVTTTKAEG